MSDAPRTSPEKPRPTEAPLANENQIENTQFTESEETGINLMDSVLDEEQSNFAPEGEGNSTDSKINYGKLAIEAVSDSIRQANNPDGILDRLDRQIDGRMTGNRQDNRYLAMLNGSGQGKKFESTQEVKQPNGSSYTVGADGYISSFTHKAKADSSPDRITNIAHDKNGYLKSYTDHKGFQFERISDVDNDGYGTWQASKNGRVYKYGGTDTNQFRAKMVLDENGLSKLIGKPSEGQRAHQSAGKMYWRTAENDNIHAIAETNGKDQLTGLSSTIEMANGDKFTRASKFKDGRPLRTASETNMADGIKKRMDYSEPKEIEFEDAFGITYGDSSKTVNRMGSAESDNGASESSADQIEITDVAKLFDKLAGPKAINDAISKMADAVSPYMAPVYEALSDLGEDGGYLDKLSSKAEATQIASAHTRRYNEHMNGPRNDVHEERGLVTKDNGLSYRIDSNGKLTEITFPLAQGEKTPAKYSNIKYDQEGKLKEYKVASGHKFTRQGPEDENGFAKWKCTWTSPNGRVHNTKFAGAGDHTYNANVKIDTNGASVLMGEPLSEAAKATAGNLYYRSAQADRTSSTPIRDQEGKTIGIKTKMEVDGEVTSLDSKFDQNGELKPDFTPMAAEAIGRLYEGVSNLTQDGGMLDRAQKSVEARELADIQDDRYSLMQKGAQAKRFDSPGQVNQEDGSSFVVGDNNRITSFTFANSESSASKSITNAKYDQDGHLKSYVDSSGFLFNRTTPLDENGFGTWQASKNGFVHNYNGTNTRQFRANMMLDEKGLTKLIGEPIAGQPHTAQGKMYWRNSDGGSVNSTPQKDADNKVVGIDSDITLANGEKFTRSSSFDENNQLESNLNLAKQEKMTEEQIERKAKVEEIKDKIESLEDPIRELTDAFKKFEQIGGLQIHQDRDGSYKANLQYRGPNWLPSQFSGPVTYKRGRPVWSKGMTIKPEVSFNFRPTDDGVMVDRMKGVFSSASWKGIHASGPQNWMQLGKFDNGTPYMMANTTSTGGKQVLFWHISRTETNTNTFTASDFKHNTGMRNMLSDSKAIDGLNGALKLFEKADVSSLSLNRPNPRKPSDFDVDVSFNQERELKLDEKLEGPLELDSIKLAKDLKFKIRQGADGADRDRNPDSVEIDASGITANIQIGNAENRLLKVQPRKVTLAKDESGNAVMQMHIESDQIKRLQSANLELDLKDLDKLKSSKVTLVNVPLLKAFSGAAMKELADAAARKER